MQSTGLSKRNGAKFRELSQGSFRNWQIGLCISRSLCQAALEAGFFKQGTFLLHNPVLRASQNRLRCLRRSFSELGGHPLSVALIVRVLDFCIKYSKEVTWQKRSPHLVLNAAPPRTWNTQLFEFGRLTQNSNTQRRRLIIVSLIYAPAPLSALPHLW